MRKLLLIIPLLLALAACNAPAPTTPAVPTVPDTPVVKVLKAADRAAISLDAAARAARSVCVTAQILDADTCAETAIYVRAVGAALDKILLACSGADAWPVVQLKIAGILANLTTTLAVPDPALKAKLDAVTAAVVEILGVR